MSRDESHAAARVTRYAAPALFLAGLGVTALVLVASLAFHDGLRSPTLGFCGLVVCLLFALAFLVVRGFEFAALNVRWDTNAYGSIV